MSFCDRTSQLLVLELMCLIIQTMCRRRARLCAQSLRDINIVDLRWKFPATKLCFTRDVLTDNLTKSCISIMAINMDGSLFDRIQMFFPKLRMLFKQEFWSWFVRIIIWKLLWCIQPFLFFILFLWLLVFLRQIKIDIILRPPVFARLILIWINHFF